MTSANQPNQPLLQNDPRDELNNSSLIHGPRHSKKRSATHASKRCHPNEKVIYPSPVPTFWDSGDSSMSLNTISQSTWDHSGIPSHKRTKSNNSSLLHDEAKNFWQTSSTSTKTTLKNVFKRNCQKFAETIPRKLLDPTGIKSCLTHAR